MWSSFLLCLPPLTRWFNLGITPAVMINSLLSPSQISLGLQHPHTQSVKTASTCPYSPQCKPRTTVSKSCILSGRLLGPAATAGRPISLLPPHHEVAAVLPVYRSLWSEREQPSYTVQTYSGFLAVPRSLLPVDNRVVFTTADPDMPLPDRSLLLARTAIMNDLHVSGMDKPWHRQDSPRLGEYLLSCVRWWYRHGMFAAEVVLSYDDGLLYYKQVIQGQPLIVTTPTDVEAGMKRCGCVSA